MKLLRLQKNLNRLIELEKKIAEAKVHYYYATIVGNTYCENKQRIYKEAIEKLTEEKQDLEDSF